jgi:hypothetical protein
MDTWRFNSSGLLALSPGKYLLSKELLSFSSEREEKKAVETLNFAIGIWLIL